jgi:hypothetical protein
MGFASLNASYELLRTAGSNPDFYVAHVSGKPQPRRDRSMPLIARLQRMERIN